MELQQIFSWQFCLLSYISQLFSIIICVWTVVAFVNSSKRAEILTKVLKLFSILNGVLYILFIVCVVAFVLENPTPNSFQICGKTIQTTTSQSTAQYAVSLFYSILLLVLSFAMSVAFAILGIKLATDMKLPHSKSRFLHRAAAIATFFFLHAIFILVLIVLTTPNMYLTFFGMVITEILPSITFIAISFKQDDSSVTSSSPKGSSQTKANGTSKEKKTDKDTAKENSFELKSVTEVTESPSNTDKQ